MSKTFNMVGNGGGSIKLEGIEITTQPTTTSYLVGDSFDPTGMVVTATYSNGATLIATGWSYTPDGALGLDDTEVIITFTDSGVSKSTALSIEVSRISVAVPYIAQEPTYSGTSSNPEIINYDGSTMEVDEELSTTFAVNAGTYYIYIDLIDPINYMWEDGTNDTIKLEWQVYKAENSAFALSSYEETLTKDNGAVAITVTRSGDGELGIAIDDESIATAELIGNVITITGIKSGTTTLTVTVAESDNYLGASLECTIIVKFWEWGEDEIEVDEEWFEGLHEYLSENEASEDWIGTTKTVTLSTAVLDTTTLLILCIDVNKDAANSVTFQTKNCLSTSIVWTEEKTSGYEAWIGSVPRDYCQDFYTAFPYNQYILTIQKGTIAQYQGDIVYNDETVFLPSVLEMGISPTSAYDGYDYEHTYGVDTSYSYYTSKAAKIKYTSDSDTTACKWWLRSRYHGSNLTASYAYVWIIGTDGSGDASFSSYSSSSNPTARLAPAFVIG